MRPIETGKDFLTNCYAREGLIPYLKKMEEEYLTNKRPFSVLIMDVDHFKSFNDKYGHLYGDEVLKYFSSSMRLDLEDEENAAFRFGGDEFVTVFPNKAPGDAYRLASRLRKNIRTRSCLIKGRQISITFSGGISGYPTDANTIEDILDKADKALSTRAAAALCVHVGLAICSERVLRSFRQGSLQHGPTPCPAARLAAGLD